MAKAAPPQKVKARERIKQIGTLVAFTARNDKRFILIASAAALLPMLLMLALILFAGFSWVWLFAGVLLALLAFMIVLSNRSNKAMLARVEGEPGAAVSVIETMRGDWRVTPAIASTTQFDMVTLVIGRPGVILVGEGHASRVRSLIGQEKRRLSKVIGTADMHDIIIGRGQGEIPIQKLRMTLMKMPRTMSGKDVNALSVRLKALTARPQMPKGAIPKNMRPQGVNFRQPRGR
jgi:hypothetical protein